MGTTATDGTEAIAASEVRVGDFFEDGPDCGEVTEVSRLTPNLVSIRFAPEGGGPDDFIHCHEAYEIRVSR